MKVAEYSVQTNATPQAVWKVWSDVKNWPAWDHDVISCEMAGGFQVGAKGILKPKGGPKVHIEITKCVAEKSFTSTSSLPLWTSLVFTHNMHKIGDKLNVTHHVEMRGCLAWLFYLCLGRSIRKGLPEALGNLVQRAEKNA